MFFEEGSVRDCSGNPFCLPLAKRLQRKARPEGARPRTHLPYVNHG